MLLFCVPSTCDVLRSHIPTQQHSDGTEKWLSLLYWASAIREPKGPIWPTLFIYVACWPLEAFDLISPKNHGGHWKSMIVAQPQEGEGLGWGVIKNAPPFLSFILPSVHGVFSYILSIIKSLKTCWTCWVMRLGEESGGKVNMRKFFHAQQSHSANLLGTVFPGTWGAIKSIDLLANQRGVRGCLRGPALCTTVNCSEMNYH